MDTTAFFLRRGSARSGAACLLLAGFPAILGCSSSDALKKQVGSLETQVTAMRADQDRLEERLAAVELSSPVASRPGHAGPTAERVEHPRLKVIQLGPEGDEPAAAEPAPAPAGGGASEGAGRRPIIRGTGDRVIKVGDGEDGAQSSLDTKSRQVALARQE
jgi:hypothetical protein